MKIEPQTELDKAIAKEWPQRWEQANKPAVYPSRAGWASNAKRRNRLRREYLRQKVMQQRELCNP